MRKFIALAALVALAGSALAQFSARAVDNATIQPGGPRSGSNGKRFFNIEGNDYGQFASWGVLDFNSTDLGIGFQVNDITSLVLRLYDRPAGFSANGNVNFYITENTLADIQPGTSTLIFQSGDLPEGLAGQMDPIYYLGTGSYTVGTRGDIIEYTLTLDANSRAYLISQINAGGRIRLVVAPAENSVAATYSGYTDTLPDNVTSAAPTLLVDAVGGDQNIRMGSFTLSLGSLLSGDITSTYEVDEDRLIFNSISSPFPGLDFLTRVDYLSETISGSVNNFDVTVTARAFGSQVKLRVWVRNPVNGQFIQQGGDFSLTTDDQKILVQNIPGSFVDGNGQVTLRLESLQFPPALSAHRLDVNQIKIVAR